MSRKCSICGGENADILCSHCGKFICERCYDVEVDACVRCTGKIFQKNSVNESQGFLFVGFILMMMGLLVTSWALLPMSYATVFLFPFVFHNMNNTAVLFIVLIFFGMFSLSSLVLLYLIMIHRDTLEYDIGVYTLQDAAVSSRGSTETIEYIITTEVPKVLRDSIYIEEDEDNILLLSTFDDRYFKTYSIPEDFHTDTVESEYEGNFLLIKVRLIKDN